MEPMQPTQDTHCVLFHKFVSKLLLYKDKAEAASVFSKRLSNKELSGPHGLCCLKGPLAVPLKLFVKTGVRVGLKLEKGLPVGYGLERHKTNACWKCSVLDLGGSYVG